MNSILGKIELFQKNFFNFIMEPNFTGAFLIIKIIFTVLSSLMVVAIIFLFFESRWFKFFFVEDFVETFTKRPYRAKEALKRWLKIEKRLASDKEGEHKLALIEADALLGEVLNAMGNKGENVGEQLKTVDTETLPSLEQVKDAHNLRNDIVYDPDFRLSPDTAKRALDIYEKALRELEVF